MPPLIWELKRQKNTGDGSKWQTHDGAHLGLHLRLLSAFPSETWDLAGIAMKRGPGAPFNSAELCILTFKGEITSTSGMKAFL